MGIKNSVSLVTWAYQPNGYLHDFGTVNRVELAHVLLSVSVDNAPWNTNFGEINDAGRPR
jgi:hypothetical protein